MTQFKVALKMADKEYKETAESVDEALSRMPLDWNNIKTKGTITISKGKETYEHFFPLSKLKKLFGNKLTRGLWAKRLEFLLGEGKETNEIKKLEV